MQTIILVLLETLCIPISVLITYILSFVHDLLITNCTNEAYFQEFQENHETIVSECRVLSGAGFNFYLQYSVLSIVIGLTLWYNINIKWFRYNLS